MKHFLKLGLRDQINSLGHEEQETIRKTNPRAEVRLCLALRVFLHCLQTGRGRGTMQLREKFNVSTFSVKRKKEKTDS